MTDQDHTERERANAGPVEIPPPAPGRRVKGHTAHMTGAFWFVIVDDSGNRQTVDGIEYWDRYADAYEAAGGDILDLPPETLDA